METLKYSTETKCAKSCACNFCGEKILIGENYMKSTHKYDGQVYDWKTHKYCQQLANDLNMFEDADEGVTSDMFCESVESHHFDIIAAMFPEDEIIKYSDVLQQIRQVRFREKMWFIIRHLNKLKQQNFNPLTH